MALSLIVIYVTDLAASRTFYETTVGLTFTEERHGNGPVHYATVLDDGLVLELSPAGPGRPPTKTRLDFTVPGAESGAWVSPDTTVVTINGGNPD